ncbi:hypothetical protein MC885_006046 [Smutsia gigantea]|nr:hypothetical protein MC885_006046 [Smutsia gigantea]
MQKVAPPKVLPWRAGTPAKGTHSFLHSIIVRGEHCLSPPFKVKLPEDPLVVTSRLTIHELLPNIPKPFLGLSHNKSLLL